MKSDSERPLSDVRSHRAIRLTFSFRGATVQLLAEQAVEMLVLPSADLHSDPPKAAFWFEVQDKRGEPLYRRFDRNPLDPWVEVMTGDPERPLANRKSERREGFFTFLVPDLNGAHSVSLFGLMPAQPGTELDVSTPPTEIARFTLANAIDSTVKVPDTTPPTTISDTLISYVESATIHLIARDNAGGSGVAHTYYKIDGGAQQEGATVFVSIAGKHRLEFWSVDRARNVERVNTVSFTVVPSTEKGSP